MRACVIGAKDEAERVDEEKPLAWHLAHHTIGGPRLVVHARTAHSALAGLLRHKLSAECRVSDTV